MRIFSKQALKFPHPAGETDPLYVRDNDFVDVPDWVKETETYKAHHKHGNITVIENKQDEIEAEKKAKK